MSDGREAHPISAYSVCLLGWTMLGGCVVEVGDTHKVVLVETLYHIFL